MTRLRADMPYQPRWYWLAALPVFAGICWLVGGWGAGLLTGLLATVPGSLLLAFFISSSLGMEACRSVRSFSSCPDCARHSFHSEHTSSIHAEAGESGGVVPLRQASWCRLFERSSALAVAFAAFMRRDYGDPKASQRSALG